MAVLWGTPVLSQSGSFLDDTDIQPYTAGGSLSLTAGTYTVDGIPNRRAPGLIQANANMNFSLFGLQSGLTFAYSTDDNNLRQNMNTLSYNATWRWLTLQAGDVNSSLSAYGLSGTTIRGGYIRAVPGDFLIELTGGRTQRAVNPSRQVGHRQPSYEQWAAAGKIGFEKSAGTYFHLSSFYAIDNVHSIQSTDLEIEPRENLTLTPDFRVRLFDGALTIGSEVTLSALTRNLNSKIISVDGTPVPAFITNIYKPRTSSRVNYAGSAEIGLTLDMMGLNMGFERVQPGFRSLGRSRVRDDQQKITINPSVQFLQDRINISSNISLGKDNLMGNRLQTQRNSNIGTNVQFNISDFVSVNTSYNLLLNSVTAEQADEEFPTADQNQVSHNISLQPSFTISTEDYIHNISVSGSYLTITSKFESSEPMPQDDYSSEAINTNFSYSVTLPAGLSLNSSVSYMINESGNATVNNTGMNLGASYAMFDSKLNLSLNTGLNRNSSEQEIPGGDMIANKFQQISAGVNTSYRLTGKDSFSLNVRTRNSSLIEGTGSEFTELEGTIQYQRSF